MSYKANKGDRFLTRSGYRTVGDEIQALSQGEHAVPKTPYANPASTFSLSADLAAAFAAEGVRRGLTAQELIQEILAAVVDDGLFAALLDG